MATTDFRRVPDQQLEQLVGMVRDNPDFIPDPGEREALIAEYNRREVGLPPDADANLQASSTPITPDPPLKPKPTSKPPVSRDAQHLTIMRQLMADGMPREEAMRQAASAVIQQDMAAVQARTPEGGYPLGPEGEAYYRATGAEPPTKPKPKAKPKPVDPNDWEGRWQQYEAENYPVAETDRDELNQWLDRRNNPARYAGRMSKDEFMGQLASDYYRAQGRQELETYGSGKDRTPQQQANVAARAQREKDSYKSMNRLEADVARLGRETGIDRNVLRQRLAKERGITLPEGAALRDDIGSMRDDDLQRRKAHWQAVTMLAGGSNNLNAGNRAMYNQLAMLPPGVREEQLAFALPGGRERAAVEAANNAQLTQLGLRVATGQGFQMPNQAMQAAQAMAAQEEALARGEPRRTATETTLGDKYAPGHWLGLPAWLGGGYDEFTPDEQRQMYNDLVGLGYSDAEARLAVDREARKRRASVRINWGEQGL